MRLLYLLISVILLCACAPVDAPKSEHKFGMHIDAVLEFVIEYPLKWTKDRRVPFNSNEGELRWTHPDHDETLLRISSFLRTQRSQNVDILERLDVDYPGIKIDLDELTQKPFGEARHIMGRTAQAEIEIYWVTSNNRNYLISLATPPEKRPAASEIINTAVESFQVLP